MEVGADEIVRLEEAGRREHEVGQVGSVGLEQVEHDREQILALERASRSPRRGFDAAMLMFQQNNACARVGSTNTSARSICSPAAADQPATGSDKVLVIDSARIASRDVRPARAWPAEIAGQSRQHRHRSQRVTAMRLTLEALAQPQQRRPLPYVLRRRSINAADTPVVCSAHRGVHGSSSGSSSWKPSV